MRPFLTDTITGETVTFGEMDSAARAIGAEFRRHGVAKGDRIVFLLNNSGAFAKLYFGCLWVGAVSVPVNPVLFSNEIRAILDQCKARLIVASPETLAETDAASISPPGCELLILDDGVESKSPGNGAAELWRLDGLDGGNDLEPFEGVTPDDTMTIVFTSGTTSTPTGVVHRISDMIDNARLFNRRMEIGPDNRFYNFLPLTYLGGYYNLLLLPYAAEASVVLGKTFSARSALKLWQDMIEHDVNTLWFTPTIMAILLELDRARGA